MSGKTFFAAFLIVVGLALIYIVVSGKTNAVKAVVTGASTSTAKAA